MTKRSALVGVLAVGVMHAAFSWRLAVAGHQPSTLRGAVLPILPSQYYAWQAVFAPVVHLAMASVFAAAAVFAATSIERRRRNAPSTQPLATGTPQGEGTGPRVGTKPRAGGQLRVRLMGVAAWVVGCGFVVPEWVAYEVAGFQVLAGVVRWTAPLTAVLWCGAGGWGLRRVGGFGVVAAHGGAGLGLVAAGLVAGPWLR